MSEYRLTQLLKGHCASVLCCKIQGESNIVASGAEDGSICLFDIESGALITRCAEFPEPDVTSIAFHPSESHRVFTACGAEVVEFDTRAMPTNFSDGTVKRYPFSAEEINGIDIHASGNYLAAADDSGDIMVIDLNRGASLQRLHGIHTNIASSTLFSRYSDDEVLSGGLEGKLICWDFKNGACIWSRKMGGEEEVQMLNPPMVHSFDMPGGKVEDQLWPGLTAAARGDGVIWVGFGQGIDGGSGSESEPSTPHESRGEPRVGDGNGEDYVLLGPSLGGHSSCVSCVKFMGEGRRLVSGSSDKRLVGWDWLAACEGEEDENPRVWVLAHGEKVNALDVGQGDLQALVVGDVGVDVSVYHPV
ncbi:hypothetical protein BSKO_13725 [Bryopsis sp. KO-2023]|nr:hypothetical protein BSKO_13725 [Bryopsis sp. KO-2023]